MALKPTPHQLHLPGKASSSAGRFQHLLAVVLSSLYDTQEQVRLAPLTWPLEMSLY